MNQESFASRQKFAHEIRDKLNKMPIEDRKKTEAGILLEVRELDLKTRIKSSFEFIQATMKDPELNDWSRRTFRGENAEVDVSSLVDFVFGIFGVRREDLKLVPDLFPDNIIS